MQTPKLIRNRLGERAAKTMALLRKVPKVKLWATAGLTLALFATATQGSKTYEKEHN
jgi:hypothetical protein